jgi:phage replication O-like protein O
MMKFDNGKIIKDYTTMDNDILESIYKQTDLTPSEMRVLLSLCRHVMWHDDTQNIVQSSWYAAIDFTAQDCVLSKKTVQRAYNKLINKNVIFKTLKLRETNVQGKIIPRWTIWITLNTDPTSWWTCTYPDGQLCTSGGQLGTTADMRRS